MLRDGRGVDNSGFSPWHRLFYRCSTEDVEGDRLIPSRIRYQNTSVNWSKYSKPWDVIFDHERWGFAQVLVRHLPSRLPKELPADKKQAAKARRFVLAAEHDPLDTNYSHSEIRTFVDGVRLPEADLSKTARKEFRVELSDRCLILWHPTDQPLPLHTQE